MNAYHILVVDDDPLQRSQIRDMLEAADLQCTLVEAEDGLDAIQKIGEHDFDVVLTDKRMPNMDGDELCDRIRHDLSLPLVPIIMITASTATEELAKSFRAGATDFVCKPYNPIELMARIKSAAQVKRLTDELVNAESLLFALARTVEGKNKLNLNHCSRLSHMAMVFGNWLGLDEDQIDALQRGAILHDIGDIAIPDRILQKEGRLTEEEWAILRKHPTIGANLCMNVSSLKEVLPIIKHHHERWNGSGYPDGLAGEAIPLLARIFQVVDIYDALSSQRPHREAMSVEQIISVLHQESVQGLRDPYLVREFLFLLETEPELLQLSDNVVKSADEQIVESIFANGNLTRSYE